ncbi:hypothetical protein M5689_002047 [Euphorbia peplus]|nr:hypothetical protein M5689_002047 [Euphorbia peplus]
MEAITLITLLSLLSILPSGDPSLLPKSRTLYEISCTMWSTCCNPTPTPSSSLLPPSPCTTLHHCPILTTLHLHLQPILTRHLRRHRAAVPAAVVLTTITLPRITITTLTTASKPNFPYWQRC